MVITLSIRISLYLVLSETLIDILFLKVYQSSSSKHIDNAEVRNCFTSSFEKSIKWSLSDSLSLSLSCSLSLSLSLSLPLVLVLILVLVLV